MATVKIGITGATGFLGWHIRVSLLRRKDCLPVCLDRESFADSAGLRDFVAGCDAIVHLAGLNRGGDHDIETANVTLAECLVGALVAADVRPHVVFANSTHSSRDTAYGRSKRQAANVLSRWARVADARFTDLILPHVFGESCLPHYNSVVATFCHELAHGGTPRIDRNTELELVHAQSVAAFSLDLIQKGVTGRAELRGTPLMVSDLLQRLEPLARNYRDGVIPCLRDRLDRELFNTYRWFHFPEQYPVSVALHSDKRGALFEAVRSRHRGQAYLSITRPGVTRGNHYHTGKFERFLVIQGEALIRVRRLLHRKIHEFALSGTAPQYVDMPTFHTHDISNVGSSDLITLFWADELFDPANPDTYVESVQP